MTNKHLPQNATPVEGVELAHRGEQGISARTALARVPRELIEHADRIHIEGLVIFANHGVYPEENALGQKFVVSLTLFYDAHRAGTTDDLDASIDYGAVCHDVDTYVRAHTHKLIEAVAEGIASQLLDAYPALLALRVKVEKPWAPIGLPLTGVSVEIERTR